MQELKRTVPQTDPPRSARETLPTMYDLPSEDPEEPGLPDEYHYLQPHLLSATLQLSTYAADEVFSVGDMNLYFEPSGALVPTPEEAAHQARARAARLAGQLRELGVEPEA